MTYSIDDTNEKLNVPKVLANLFEANLEDIFKVYREGDPIIPKTSELPAIYVTEPETNYNAGPTGYDDIVHEILIQVIFNKKKDFGNPDKGSSLDSDLDSVVQGRDATTGEYKEKTIMGVLRKNFTLDNLVVQNIGTVRKGIIERSEELITAESHIEITVTELQSVTNRE